MIYRKSFRKKTVSPDGKVVTESTGYVEISTEEHSDSFGRVSASVTSHSSSSSVVTCSVSSSSHNQN